VPEIEVAEVLVPQVVVGVVEVREVQVGEVQVREVQVGDVYMNSVGHGELLGTGWVEGRFRLGRPFLPCLFGMVTKSFGGPV